MHKNISNQIEVLGELAWVTAIVIPETIPAKAIRRYNDV